MRDDNLVDKKRSNHFDKTRLRRKLAARNKLRRKANRKLARVRRARR